MAYTSGSQSITEGSQGRNLDVGTEMKTMEELGLLTALHGLLSYLSYNDHLPRDGISHHQLPPPTSSVLQTCPQTILIWSVLPLGRFPGDSGYVKLTAQAMTYYHMSYVITYVIVFYLSVCLYVCISHVILQDHCCSCLPLSIEIFCNAIWNLIRNYLPHLLTVFW